MDVFSSRVRWCPNLLFRFLTKMFGLPRYVVDFWGYFALKNASMRAKKHVNFTVYQMGRHAVRYVATNKSAKLLPPSSKRSYALTEQITYHHNTYPKCLNIIFKDEGTSERKITCYFLQTLHEVMVLNNLIL
jgi:hypothetical protein